MTGYVALDKKKVDYEMLRNTWNPSDLIRKVKKHVRDPKTIRGAIDGKRVQMHTARHIAEALGVPLIHILAAEYLPQLTSDSTSVQDHFRDIGLADWEPVKLISHDITSNGLRFMVAQVRQRHVPETIARGKCYDFNLASTAEQERMKELLVRHPKVCERLKDSPHIAKYRTTGPDLSGNGWWVIDEWIPGCTLHERLAAGPLDEKLLPQVMRQIAEGLKTLHTAKIIRRELSPRFIMLREPDDSVVLTDFELAKLLEGNPTVSNDWPIDRYRAPEIGGQPLTENDYHVDLYSWGRIFVEAATGQLPPVGEEAEALASVSLPDKVKKFVLKCVAPVYSDRPNNIDLLFKAIRGWQ